MHVLVFSTHADLAEEGKAFNVVIAMVLHGRLIISVPLKSSGGVYHCFD